MLEVLFIRGETNERNFEYSFENWKGEQMNSHIHVRAAKDALYLYMTVMFLVPAFCTADDVFRNTAQFNSM